MICSSIGSKILSSVSPSMEVQKQFKDLIACRIKSVALVTFGSVALYGLINPITFQAAIVSTPLIFTIGFVAMLALTVYQCKNMPFDADALRRAKALSNDKKGQSFFLKIIKPIPLEKRDLIFEGLAMFSTNKMSDDEKGIIIKSLYMVSDEILNSVMNEHADVLKGLLQVTPFALSIFLLIEMDEDNAKIIIDLGKGFCEHLGIQELILGKLEELNEQLPAAISKLAKLDPFKTEERIFLKSEIGKPVVIEFLLFCDFINTYLEELGLNKESPIIQEMSDWEKSLNLLLFWRK